MESTDYLKVLRRRWKIILASGLLSALVVLLLVQPEASGLGARSYTATATLLQPVDGALGPEFTALLVTTGPVPVAVAEQLDYAGEPTELSALVQVSPDAETGAVQISTTSTDPEQAALIANTFAEATLAEVADRTTGAVAGVPPIELLERATPLPNDDSLLSGPTTQSGRLVLGLVVGLVLGSALALLVERFDTSVRDRIDVQRAYRVPVLAEVPRLPRSARSSRGVIVKTDPASTAAEAFRSLRSSVLLIPSRVLLPADADQLVGPTSERGRPQIILVTSARAGEGKTTTAVNLAAALAESGQQTLVLDFDFRRPDAHRYLDVINGPGLSDLVHAEEGEHELRTLCRPSAVDGVRMVPAGTMIDQPPALPTRIAGLLSDARGLADVVIVDSPPMLLGNDAMDLMPYVDTVLVTCRSGRVTRDQAERASELLARLRVPVVGAAFIGWRASVRNLGERIAHRSGALTNSEFPRRDTGASAHRAES
ncbi:polysaccharide biosynthesis tyrosine autokinase [Blastococcus saxobsidens]|uniref:Non-specific protein-tyrosine kinase n=1 Tax=Blastococcus saxobsidens (strain DD2) TaxID=1146883 RepID=H6RM75_BLASD|nr:polysaccharide biosynthesis tyrosine autokinase [Blastococcus saxobsidens]CCG01317.1 putative protein-tyrosine kinase involved in surface polysaccharides and lipopolysaccharides synthesis [Blastococcus saxobsidens DD2]